MHKIAKADLGIFGEERCGRVLVQAVALAKALVQHLGDGGLLPRLVHEDEQVALPADLSSARIANANRSNLNRTLKSHRKS